MSLRDQLQTALKEAMKPKQADRLSTLRLINAAIKDRDIANRGEGGEGEISEAEILAALGRMVKQRQESARAYEEGGRLELAEKETAEIKVIEEFLPRQLEAAEVEAAIAAAVAEVTPGIISYPMPAWVRAVVSSSRRPKMPASPDFKRTTF